MSNQFLTAQCVGFDPPNPASGVATLALNGAASGGYSGTWLDFAFCPRFISGTKQVSKVRVYASGVNGTLGANDLVADIFNDGQAISGTMGIPGHSLQSVNTVTSTPGSGGGIVEFTGWGSAATLTAQQQYHLVLRNANANPTTNYPTYRFGQAGMNLNQTCGSTTIRGWFKQHSPNSGTGWTSAQAAVFGVRIDYTDGSSEGLMAINNVWSGDKVYGTNGGNESGVKFTSPANASLVVAGIAGALKMQGTPTGPPFFKLYVGSNPAVSTAGIAINSTFNQFAGWTEGLYFSTGSVTIPPGTVCRVTLADGNTSGLSSDGPSNYFAGYEYTMDSDPASLALLPFEGTWQKTYWNGTAWTDTPAAMFPFSLVLDSTGEFASGGGGSGGASILSSKIIQGLGRL